MNSEMFISTELMDNLSKETITAINKLSVTLVYLGVKIVDSKFENRKIYGYEIKYWFSVPESSTLNSFDEKTDAAIKTSDGLIDIFKDYIIQIFGLYFKDIYKNDENIADESIEYIKNHIKYYVKIRKGEIWSKEKAEAIVDEIVKELEKTTGFNEV